jgi:hypothetical protein
MTVTVLDHAVVTGDAGRVTDEQRRPEPPGEPVDALYAGKKANLRPLHDQLMAVINAFGTDVTTVPKKGYLSIRRKKQFAMIQPSPAGRLDIGLILPGTPPAGRLEPAGSFNALFTHRVRVTSADDIDTALTETVGTTHHYLTRGRPLTGRLRAVARGQN